MKNKGFSETGKNHLIELTRKIFVFSTYALRSTAFVEVHKGEKIIFYCNLKLLEIPIIVFFPPFCTSTNAVLRSAQVEKTNILFDNVYLQWYKNIFFPPLCTPTNAVRRSAQVKKTIVFSILPINVFN